MNELTRHLCTISFTKAKPTLVAKTVGVVYSKTKEILQMLTLRSSGISWVTPRDSGDSSNLKTLDVPNVPDITFGTFGIEIVVTALVTINTYVGF